jgi:hypothetical protein
MIILIKQVAISSEDKTKMQGPDFPNFHAENQMKLQSNKSWLIKNKTKLKA